VPPRRSTCGEPATHYSSRGSRPSSGVSSLPYSSARVVTLAGPCM
jgi:hypothetical protein